MNKMKLLLTLAAPALLFQAAQAQSSRLTAQAHWIHNGAEFKRYDSTAYNYLSTSRGGDLNSQLKFDEGTSWIFVMGDTQNNNQRWIQEFDANNNLTTSVEQNWDMVLMTWANTFKSIYTYNANNTKATMIRQHWDGTSSWITDSKNTYSYNAAGKMEQDQYATWDGTAYTLQSDVTYYYDAAGNKINETGRDWSTTTPVYTNRINYTYTTSNKLKTLTNGNWSGTAWTDVDMYTHEYDTTGNKVSTLHSIWNGTAFQNSQLSLYSSFTGGNAASETVQMWDTTGTGSWKDTYHFAHTYNSNGKLTSSTRQSYDMSIPGWVSASGDTKTNYYYGTFVSVKSVSNNGGTATLFPVPAESTLNIQLNWNRAQASTVIIADMQGRVVKTTSVAAGQNNISFNVADLADGIYMVNISGAEGQIVKQIAVAH